MARVCLVRIPFFKLLGIKKVHFPLSIGYLASYLEKGGHNVSFVDGEATEYGLYKGLLYKSFMNEIIFYANPYFIDRKIKVVSKIMQDRNANVWNILIKKISETKPDVIGISCYTVDMTAAGILAGRIKKDLGNIPCFGRHTPHLGPPGDFRRD